MSEETLKITRAAEHSWEEASWPTAEKYSDHDTALLLLSFLKIQFLINMFHLAFNCSQ